MAGGHENAGDIVKKGKAVNDEFQVGDHVAFSYPFCGLCEACRKGNTMGKLYERDNRAAVLADNVLACAQLQPDDAVVCAAKARQTRRTPLFFGRGAKTHVAIVV